MNGTSKVSVWTIACVLVFSIFVFCSLAGAQVYTDFSVTGNLVEVFDGHAVKTELRKALTLHRESRFASPNVVIFDEQKKLPCVQNECKPSIETTAFQVVSVEPYDRCGTRIIKGSELSRDSDKHPREIQIIDRTIKLCSDYQRYVWQLELTDSNQDTRTFFGESEPVHLNVR